jgi:Fic family protein
MNLDLEIEFSKAPILQEIDALKKQIDDMRPLPADIEGRVMQKLRLDWNYNSNAIEGNKLSYGETVAFLMEGITAKGKPLKDHLDIRGHNEAINFLLDLVKDSRPISEADIRALHKMILVEPYQVDAQTADGKPTTKTIKLGEYKEMSNHVKTATGETHYYATPDEVKVKMPELIEWYREANSYEGIHPVVVAALFHHKFVAIHPFDDGNGRLSRILMNLILMQKGFPPAVIRMDDRKNYYSLLSRADSDDKWPFVEYIAEKVQKSLNVYLKAINGGDIDEEEDISKEIALFKIELQDRIKIRNKKSKEIIKDLIDRDVVDIIDLALEVVKEFSAFFISAEFQIKLFYWHPEARKTFIDTLSIDEFRSMLEISQTISEDYENIEILFKLKEFREPNNVFDVSSWLLFKLDEYNYTVITENKTKFIKLYHEKLSVKDFQLIKKGIFRSIKGNIELNLGNKE